MTNRRLPTNVAWTKVRLRSPCVPGRAAARASGLTLVEVLLALGVLSILVAMAWPSVMRLYGEQQIVEAAEKVRALVATARVHAIESGLAYQFRFEPEGNHFIVVPFEREFEGVDPRTQGAGTAEGFGRFSKAGGNLSKDVTFTMTKVGTPDPATLAAAISEGQKLSADALEGLPNADKLSAVSWSPPIVFLPDGSAMDAEFSVIDRRRQRVSLSIRGLTGAVSVSRLQREVD